MTFRKVREDAAFKHLHHRGKDGDITPVSVDGGLVAPVVTTDFEELELKVTNVFNSEILRVHTTHTPHSPLDLDNNNFQILGSRNFESDKNVSGNLGTPYVFNSIIWFDPIHLPSPHPIYFLRAIVSDGHKIVKVKKGWSIKRK